jgi:uncharacterized protein
MINLLLGFVLITQSFAQNFPDKPVINSVVYDFADMFTDKEELKIQQWRDKLMKRKKVDLVIVSVKSLDEYNPNDYAYKLVEYWQLDKYKKQIIIVLKPKYPDERGEIIIVTRCGRLDLILPDAKVKDIIDTRIIPEFKKKEIYRGIEIGLKEIMKEI